MNRPINFGYFELYLIDFPTDEEITAEEEGAELDQAFRDNNLDAGSIKTMTL